MIIKAKRRIRHAFTLIELLVVIGIIAILVAISFPAIRAALVKANTVKCASHLRSIGVALIDFAGDNNGNLPISDTTVHYNSKGGTSGLYGWTQQLEPYIGSDKSVYQCPDSSYSFSSYNANYAYFNGVHAAKSAGGALGVNAVSLLKMHAMAQHIIAGDIAFPSQSGLTDVLDDDKDDWSGDPAFFGAVVTYSGTTKSHTGTIPIHGGYSNILFGDGHVESAQGFDATSMTTVYGGINSTNVYLQ